MSDTGLLPIARRTADRLRAERVLPKVRVTAERLARSEPQEGEPLPLWPLVVALVVLVLIAAGAASSVLHPGPHAPASRHGRALPAATAGQLGLGRGAST